ASRWSAWWPRWAWTLSLGPVCTGSRQIRITRKWEIVYNETISPKRHRAGVISVFPGPAAQELLVSLELELDHVLGRLVGEFERLLVELFGGEVDEHFRLDEELRPDRGERLAQVILHARAAQEPGRARLHRHRLALERLVLEPRNPVDEIFEPARDR